MSEKTFMDHLMIALCDVPGVRVWRQNSGSIAYWDPEQKCERVFRSGVPKGACDLSGIYGPTGQRIEIEAKVMRRKRTAEQIHWAEFIQQRNGLYMLATKENAQDDEESAKEWAAEFARSVIR